MDNTGIVNLSHYGWTWAVKCEKMETWNRNLHWMCSLLRISGIKTERDVRDFFQDEIDAMDS
jgi:hypothetical protein